MGNDLVEKDGEISSQEDVQAEQEPAIALSKSRFVLVLIGLVLAVFLVRLQA